MVTVEQARKLLIKNINTLKPVRKDLHETEGLVISEDIISPIDIPTFTSSAIDGYAVLLSAIQGKFPIPLKIKGEIRAGDTNSLVAKEGEAIRIFIGTPVPAGTDCVIMQEHNREDVYLHFC